MSKALEVLKEYWHYDEFRPLQSEIIEHVIAGNDAFVLLPTGGGKSLCFQVPALIHEGITLVISPLISLIKDQVNRLKKIQVPAEGVYSGMHAKTIHRILNNCTFGKVKMLYLSPERLSSPIFLEYLARFKVSMIVLDEAHCISQWGYDFRPAYLNINETIKLCPGAVTMTLTASATVKVVEDIRQKLDLGDIRVFQQSYLRRNLTYVVRNTHDKRAELINLINNVKGSGIIYVRSRKATSEVAHFLKNQQISSSFYHAGLKNDTLSKIQEEWMTGKTRIMVATTAFGMGIDKPDVRFVIHLSLPASLEEYYQEAGRGGRDGLKSYAAMFYDDTDVDILLESCDSSFPDPEDLIKVYFEMAKYLGVGSGTTNEEYFDFNLQHFCKQFNYKPVWFVKALKELEHQGYLHVTEGMYIPSQVMINYNKAELYDFQIRKPEFDLIIELLLRMYGGILNMPVRVNTLLMAKKLKTEEAVIIRMLEYLDLSGVLDFQMQKEHPQLSFGAYRYNANDLVFNMTLQNFLKDRYKEKVHSMLDFVQTPFCRNITLLDYFGETLLKECGICDICIENRQNKSGRAEIRESIDYVMNFAGGGDNSASNLITTPFYKKNKTEVQQALQFLMDENKILFENFKIKVRN